MSVGFFTDLDGTIIFSRRWLEDAPDVVPVEWDANGIPLAWMSGVAAAAIAGLRQTSVELVPTTTRVTSQFTRVTIPGGSTPVAIIANGMRILWGGDPDQEWTDRIADLSWGCAPIRTIEQAMMRAADNAPWLRRVSSEDGIGVLTAAHGARMPRTVLQELHSSASDAGYKVWQHRRKTLIIPAHATKEAAAAEVAARLGVTVTAAAGDTALDHGLLAWADLAQQPAHAEPGSAVPVTSAAGIHAGAEIVLSVLSHAITTSAR